MDQEELESLRYDYGYFELKDLYSGYLTIKAFQPPTTQLDIDLDEDYGDGVPGMVQMYNALKRRQPYDFYYMFGDQERISFEICDFTRQEEEEFVFLAITVSIESDVPMGLLHTTEISGEIPVTYLLYEFETFFKALLHHPDFPFQFPCLFYMDGKQCDEADAECERITKDLNLTDEEYIELEKKCIREHVTQFDASGEKLLKEYKEMLTEYKVPDGWTIFRKSGKETDHSF